MSIDAGPIKTALQAKDQPVELIVVAKLEIAEPAGGLQIGIEGVVGDWTINIIEFVLADSKPKLAPK